MTNPMFIFSKHWIWVPTLRPNPLAAACIIPASNANVRTHSYIGTTRDPLSLFFS